MTPAVTGGRLDLHDATACSGRWYLVGGVLTPDGDSRPAAWTSTDGRAWRPLTVRPRPGSFYGPAGARHVRLALTATDERIDAAVERLSA